jgi:phytoene dehydrogenase-like protein
VYASVHSATAQLAPDGGALIHVARYGGSRGASGVDVREELAEVLDRLQPGWRAVVVQQRFLPDMIVSHAMVTAAQGGLAGRPGPEVPGAPGVYVIGDWVGPDGMLADATLASARRAAAAILQRERAAEKNACLTM